MADKNKGMGPIQITVGADPKEKVVIIAFNTAINRIDLSPEGAVDLAKNILTRATIAGGGVAPSIAMALTPLPSRSNGVDS